MEREGDKKGRRVDKGEDGDVIEREERNAEEIEGAEIEGIYYI